MAEVEQIQIGSAFAEFSKVRLPFGLDVEILRVEGTGLLLQREPFDWKLGEPAKVVATVTDLALQAFLEHKKPGGLRDFFVQLSQGEVQVHATARVLIEIRAVAVCDLEIVEGKQLFVRLKKVDVLGVGAKSLVQKQLDEINPILDVKDLPVPLELQTVEIGDGKIVMTAALLPKS